MKTLLFSNQGLSPIHLGIELEVIQKEIDQGNKVHILYCKSNLQSCFFNPTHNILACAICEGRMHKFYKELGIPKSNFTPLKTTKTIFDLPKIEELDDIFEIKYKGYDIGRGIASNYISVTRDYKIDQTMLPLIKEMAVMSIQVIENIESQISIHQPQKVILFNGRFAEVHAIIQVCIKHKIDYYTFERSSALGKYKYFKNMLPHSLSNRKDEMEQHWAKGIALGKEKEMILISENWFNQRITKKAENLKAFFKHQKNGQLPSNFNSSKNNIAIFITSEDEHRGIKEHDFAHYRNQNEAIKKILIHFQQNSNIHFYLRVHPNLKGLQSIQIKEINKLNYSNLTVIPANSEIDSYCLIQNCNKSLSFGSTTGIEATYLKSVSISFGTSYYNSLPCCYYPSNYNQLFALLENSELKPLPIESTYKFGYYQSTIGYPIKQVINKEKISKRVFPQTFWILFSNIKYVNLWRTLTKIIFKESINFSNIFKLNSHKLNDKLN